MDSEAARQMLLVHYDSGTNPDPKYGKFYDNLNTNLKYPKYSKNYAISNGGRGKLYEDRGDNQIIDFSLPYLGGATKVFDKEICIPYPSCSFGLFGVRCKTKLYCFAPFRWVYEITAWTWTKAWGTRNNANGSYTMFEGSRQGWWNDESKSTSVSIGYENAPGGWNASLYSINCKSGSNYHSTNETNIPYVKATFMVTSSAFGIPVTKDNVYTTWDKYTGCSDYSSGLIRTPFDVVRGMSENEEHVKISKATGDYLIDSVLRHDFGNLIKPFPRLNETVSYSVNGKVAYVAKETVALGGNGNSLVLTKGAEVNTLAGSSVTLLPGFKVEEGATFTASTGNVTYATTLKSGVVSTKPADYGQPSPFRHKSHDFSTESNKITLETLKTVSLNIYPNPVRDRLYFSINSHSDEPLKVEISDPAGKTILSTTVADNDTKGIDMSSFSSGFYIVKISNSKVSKSAKIVKLNK